MANPDRTAGGTGGRGARAGLRLLAPLFAAPILASALAPAAALAQADSAPLPAPPSRDVNATGTADARALIIRPFTFFEAESMHFGQIIPSRVAGTVRLRPDGSRTATNGIVLVGTDHRPARFAGMGISGRMVNITVQRERVFLTGPGNPMELTRLEIGSTPTAILTSSRQEFRIGSANGVFVFPLGGTLSVGANQARGLYSGQYRITLTYQ